MNIEVTNKPSTELSKTVDDELMSILAKQSQRVPVPIFILALLIAFLASDYVARGTLIIWVGLVVTSLIGRRYVLGNLPDWTGLSNETRITIAAILSSINGVIHGASNFFFPENAAFEHAMQTMLLLGLGAGSVATTVGHKKIFLAYLIPTLIPNTFMWLYFGLSSDPINWVFVTVSVLVAMFGAILVALARDFFASFKESFEIRLQQAETNKQLEQALNEAESADNAKTRFLASASHDLRQPIHTLSLLGASLSMRPLDDRTKQISNHISAALDSLATQLDSLLDISKLDAGIVETNNMTADLSGICLRLHNEFETTAISKGIRLEHDIEHDALVYTDITLLERILRNLISNAIKYTSEGFVKIELKHASEKVFVISICDSGMGISEQDQKLIFEEFYQVDNPERDRNKGLGLGLAIVRRLLSLLDLKIKISSGLGEGTRFSIYIDSAIQGSYSPSQKPKHEFDWSQFRVLVIDDEAMVRFAVETLLSQLGAEVFTAESQTTAIEKASVHNPNLVLADFRLRSNESGLDTIQSLKHMFPEITAILISGDTGPDRLQQAKKAGVPFLHKPVKVSELEEAILSLTKGGSQENGEKTRRITRGRHQLSRL